MQRSVRTRQLLIPILAASCLFAEEKATPAKDADWTPNIAEVKTQTVAFPAGGVVRLIGSAGDLNIEAWDKAEVEITSVASSKIEYGDRAPVKPEFNRLTVAVRRREDELVITTAFRRRGFPPFGGLNLNVEYYIRVPRTARLSIDHRAGAVNVDGVAGDIDASLREGEIILHLPEDGQYNIDAQTRYGNVNSDFPGERHRGWFGQKALQSLPRPTRALKLRVGYGDIVLLKTRIPNVPGTGAVKLSGSGL